eukprot:4747987-Amphidinium_carterae.1
MALESVAITSSLQQNRFTVNHLQLINSNCLDLAIAPWWKFTRVLLARNSGHLQAFGVDAIYRFGQ